MLIARKLIIYRKERGNADILHNTPQMEYGLLTEWHTHADNFIKNFVTS